MIETTLIGAGLGMVPHVGPLLAGVYNAEEVPNFHQEVLDEFQNLEIKLQEIQTLLKDITLQNELSQIIAKTNNAESMITSWWTQSNGVKEYYQNNDIPLNSESINQACPDMLTGIHSVMTSTDLVAKTWVQVYIDYFINKIKTTTVPQDMFKVSCLELIYKAFLHLVQLQIKGVMCLRAAGYDNIEQQTLATLHNITQQGIYIQEEVINPYLETTHPDYESFNWFLQNNTSPNQIDVNAQPYLSTASNACSPNTVAGGIEFDNPSTAETSPTGLRIASATVDQFGDITSGSWNTLDASTSFNLLSGPGDVTHAILQWTTGDISFTNGQIITGIILNSPNQHQQSYDGKYGSLSEVNQMYVTVNSSIVKPDGSIESCPATTQSIQSTTQNSTLFSLYQLGYINDSGTRSTISSSPITGFGFCQPPGAQVGVKLQTSVHAKAFTPYGIQSSNQVAICNQIFKQSLSGVPNPINTMNFGDGEQALVLQGLSTYAVYGSIVEICLASSPTSQLTLDKNHKTVGFDPHPPAGSNLTKWLIRDPLNFQYTLPDQSSYGNPPSEQFAFNWSPVILQSAANEKLCLSLQIQPGGSYLLQAIDVTVAPEAGQQAPMKDVGNGQLLIGASNFIWNFHLLA